MRHWTRLLTVDIIHTGVEDPPQHCACKEKNFEQPSHGTKQSRDDELFVFLIYSS